jgi:hypothetical protein
VIYVEEKADALHQKLFQPLLDLPEVMTLNLTHDNPDDISWHPITREETHKAIFSPHTLKYQG